MKNLVQHLYIWASLAALSLAFTACDDEETTDTEVAHAPYVLSLGITSGQTTTYYVVSAADLMTGNINAIGKGIEQDGYYDYQQAGQTVFAIGGLGVQSIKGIRRNAEGYLQENGEYVFNNTPAEFAQADPQTMLALELPATKEAGSKMKFYTIDIASLAVKGTTDNIDLAPLNALESPYVTGMQVSAGKVYVSYLPMNAKTFATPHTDSTLVAVYSYPSMQFVKLMVDTRFGPGGSWNAFNGLLKDERGDIYVMSNSALSNGYSQATKPSGFLRIAAGSTDFDADYTFNFEQLTGGRKIAHVKYVGNGLVFAEVSTIVPQTAADRWGDKSLTCYVIDLYHKTAKEVQGMPVHNGNGGRRFAALAEGQYVYLPVSTPEGVYIYRTNMQTATAERGAKVAATFVGGVFKLQ